MPKCRTCEHWAPWFVCTPEMKRYKIGFCGHKDVAFNEFVRNFKGVQQTTKLRSCGLHEPWKNPAERRYNLRG